MKLTQAMAHNIAKQGNITISYDGRKWFTAIGNLPSQTYKTDQLEKAQAVAESWGADSDGWNDLAANAVCVLPVKEQS